MTITLATLPEATEQEVFDQVATHLITQNKQSLDITEGTYKYRGEEGTKCAAGCLIADNEYEPEMEHLDWQGLWINRLVPNNHRDIISQLQEIHDDSHISEWKNRLKHLAKSYNLELPVVLQQ